MLKRIILLTLCFGVAVFWVPESNALSITNSFLQSVNSNDDNFEPYTGSGNNLFPNGSSNTAFELNVYGNTSNDYYRSYMASNSPDNGIPYNNQGAEIWLSSISRTWVADYVGNTDPDSSGYSTASLNYQVSGASNVKLSFYYYLSAATVTLDQNASLSDYSALSNLSLIVNNSLLWSKTLQGQGQSLPLGGLYNAWITLPGDIGDIRFDAMTSCGAFGYNGYGSAGLLISNISIEAAPVPLPPSVWLFGSGLVGLIGLRRFRRS
jgi:hypothetical protein